MAPPKDPNRPETLSPTPAPRRLFALLDAPRCCRTPLQLASIFFTPFHLPTGAHLLARAPLSLAFALILGYPTASFSQFQV